MPSHQERVKGRAKRGRGISVIGRALLLAVVLALLAVGLPPAAAQPPGAPIPHYDIKARLDSAQGTLTASQVVTYYNDVGQSLDSLVFNVTPAHFGAFRLQKASVGSQEVQPSLKGVVLEIPLSQPLAPGGTVTVQLDFSLAVPSPGNLRFGRGNDITALGNWHPVLSVWRKAQGSAAAAPGWSRHAYVDTGDAFFTAVADYDVSLEINAAATIAHTGEVVNHDDFRWVFRASKVRDFALAISPRYETRSTTVGSTTITAFYLPEHRSAGQQYLKSAAESLAWFNAKLGQYPYSTLHVAETNTADPGWVGQEYPNVVFIGSQVSAAGGGIGTYLDYLVVHEVLHQWFYGLVGNDQIYEPWVDEATVTYVTYMYFRASYPAVYQSLWQRALENYEATRRMSGDRPVNTSIYDYQDENHYFGIVYRKGAIFLDELRKVMGDEAFFAFLRQYLRDNLYGIATASDFLAAAQANTSANISPLVARYFSYPAYQQPSPTVAPSTPTPEASPTTSPTPKAEPTPARVATPALSPAATIGSTVTPTTAPTTLTTPSPAPPPPDTSTTESAPLATPTAGIGEQLPQPLAGLGSQPTAFWPIAVPLLGLVVLGLALRRARVF